MSYSQNDEEQILDALFQHYKTGTILDIGAYTGKELSNSLGLIERGWGAVLVEPSPDAFRQLMKLHGRRPNVHLVNALIMPKAFSGKLTRFAVTDDAVSTADKEWEKIWSPAASTPYQPIYSPQISMLNLENLVFELGLKFDCLTLDTEGVTLQLAEEFLQTPTLSDPVKVACIEHSGAGRCDLPALDNLFTAWDKVDVNAENVIYVRRAGTEPKA